jgi:hypothetical protein
MSDRKTDIVYQHWSRVIQYESRDATALKLNAARALADRDVRSNPTLEGMIQAAIQKRWSELERETEAVRSQAATADSGVDEPSLPSMPSSALSPEQVGETLDQLARTLSKALPLGDEGTAQTALKRIQVLHKENPGVIPIARVVEFERSVGTLREHQQQLRDQIAALAQRAVAASKGGKEEELARSLRRLSAIHVAHPNLLDEAGLTEIRVATLNAADDRRQHRRTIRELLDRERTIAAEIEKLAAAVRNFRKAACEFPDTAREFRNAEATYLRAIQTVRKYDAEWFSGIVLELADLLADWIVPPPGAAGQIDRFLEGVSAGLDGIRAEIRQIKDEKDADDRDESASPE